MQTLVKVLRAVPARDCIIDRLIDAVAVLWKEIDALYMIITKAMSKPSWGDYPGKMDDLIKQVISDLKTNTIPWLQTLEKSNLTCKEPFPKGLQDAVNSLVEQSLAVRREFGIAADRVKEFDNPVFWDKISILKVLGQKLIELTYKTDQLTWYV